MPFLLKICLIPVIRIPIFFVKKKDNYQDKNVITQTFTNTVVSLLYKAKLKRILIRSKIKLQFRKKTMNKAEEPFV